MTNLFKVFTKLLLVTTFFGTKAQIIDRNYAFLIDTLLNKTVPFIEIEAFKNEKNYILLDTRSKKEFDVSHIPGAQWVGFDEFKVSKLRKIATNRPIVLYCSVGYRSEKIGEILIKNGYLNVRNLKGSIFEWVNQGNQVVNAQGKTQQIHAFDRFWGIWLKKGIPVY